VGRFFKLLFIGIANLIYNFFFGIWEFCRYCGYGWWWKLRVLFFLSYIADGPFAVIKREGPRAPVPIQNLIYGETFCSTIEKILLELNPKPNDCFVDLGCGRGMAVLFVRLFLKIPAIGVEVIPTFIKRARKIAQWLEIEQVEFIRENLSWITEEEINRGTIFYLAGTTFEDELLAKITSRLELLPEGVDLITLSEEINSSKFELIKVKSYHFSWGRTDVYFHKKVA
jgi:hypothetical protein